MAFKVSSSEGQGEHEDIAEINIIPLVDVMLVLLIVFMVAAPLSISGIQVNLPSSKAKGTTVDAGRTILSINSKGEYFIEKMPIPKMELIPRMKAIYENKDTKELFIRADRDVAYGKVVDAMGAAKLAGVTKMAMLTQSDVSKATGGADTTNRKN